MVLAQILVLTGVPRGRGARALAQLYVPEEFQDHRFHFACSRVSVGPVHGGICSLVTAGPTLVPAGEQQPAGGTRGPVGPDPRVPGSEVG